MQSNGVGADGLRPGGCVLLLAALPRSSRRGAADPRTGLDAMARVPPALLLGTDGPAPEVLPLVDPVDPVAVQHRLRSAAATPGPLLVYLAGGLLLDSRRRQLHLALADTTADTVRYTALPWEWLAFELRQRRQDDTTVLCDLVADAPAWQRISGEPDLLGLGGAAELCGVVAPAVKRARRGHTGYSGVLAGLLSTSGNRRGLAELHAMATAQAGLDPRALLLAPTRRPAVPRPVPARVPAMRSGSGDLRTAIGLALRAGRRSWARALAEDWHQRVQRTGPQSLEAVLTWEALAQVAFEEGLLQQAADNWMAAARIRLALLPAADPLLLTTVDNAHHLWGRLPAGAEAIRTGEELLRLRQAAPGSGNGRLRAVAQRLELLRATPESDPR
ncbi:hypothetical protein ACEZDB_23635 [Streptacidiphilus sp. N1-3]|uniref:Uncharacterized protein n=1 Tax=Streptacidiphilus alkalitolerans TaxID=3342712 RepID=A0ABV6X5Z9_9ACTN